jgi:hypothetical protein
MTLAPCGDAIGIARPAVLKRVAYDARLRDVRPIFNTLHGKARACPARACSISSPRTTRPAL